MNWLDAIGYEPTGTPQHIILIRVLIAAVLGGVIGFEREAKRHRAGLRTHILIAVAAALYTMLAIEIFRLSPTTQGRADPVRAIEAVTAGIAFLGAGAIFQQRGGVHGLTTGAGMWLAGAVGAATALGHYLIAAAVAILAVVVLALLGAIEQRALGGGKGEPPD
jgi:putative Mg2+ transporter-C (MgtC) family protein